MTARIEPGSVRVPSGVRAINIGRFHRVVQDRSQGGTLHTTCSSNQRRALGHFRFASNRSACPQRTSRRCTLIRPGHMSRCSSTPWCRRCAREIAWRSISWRIPPLDRKSWTISYSNVRTPRLPQNSARCETYPWLTCELRLDDFRISVNGTVLDASTRVGGSISGAALWFYVPERGRFVMSLLPNPKLGFRRAGEVTNALLSFTEGSDRYDIKSTSRIVPADGRFNLYVLHDPEWRPTGDEANSPIIVGAADRAEWLTAK